MTQAMTTPVTISEIFEGATFQMINEGEVETLTIQRVNSKEVYAAGNRFDLSRPSKEAMAEQLTKWGCRYIGA